MAMQWQRPLAVLFAVGISVAQVEGQTLALGARGGTVGLGGEAVLGFGRIAVRVGSGVLPATPSRDISGITYDVELPSPLTTVGADLSVSGGLRLFGGVLFGAEHTDFTGRLTHSAQLGNRTYTPEQAGTLEGSLRSRAAAPYLGLGFGHYAGARVGLTFDLGVAFLGSNDLLLTATGPFRDDPTFQQELERERLSAQDDLRRYTRFFPMLSLGLHIAVLR